MSKNIHLRRTLNNYLSALSAAPADVKLIILRSVVEVLRFPGVREEAESWAKKGDESDLPCAFTTTV